MFIENVNINFTSKSGNNELFPNVKSGYKFKTDSNFWHTYSSKASSRSSQNSLICSSVIEKHLKIEQAILFALQVEQHLKRNLKLLEKLFELEKKDFYPKQMKFIIKKH